MSDDLPEFPREVFDAARLTAELADPEALKVAWRRVPPLVLADILARAKVADPRKPDLSDGERRHWDGRADLALEIARTAGFSSQSIAVAVLATHLQGSDDDRHHHDGDGGSNLGDPGPDFGPDHDDHGDDDDAGR